MPSIRIVPASEYYDYHAKYVSDETRYHCPAPLDAGRSRAIQDLCVQAFDAVGARGWGRVDFMMGSDNVPQLLEINTLPGMTSHSLVPRAAAAAGMDFESLCVRLLEMTMEASS